MTASDNADACYTHYWEQTHPTMLCGRTCKHNEAAATAAATTTTTTTTTVMTMTKTHTNDSNSIHTQQQLLLLPLYGHYTGQPALADTLS